ncbi:hypothetical protein [Paenibacillus qinlingensis]|uniref:Uncharacterized protein n=1 Tax=Paenibacillus qinlingensis TaxID=1837343 RepID=A0ABU1P8T3_9BACL|nr:hypothetical protein [Paenibacillus qinlingensis]MDR6555457.1 hypothetical protein [Paenibacillus qinlingensis]
MDPIAVVTWFDGKGKERVNRCITHYDMEQLITRLREGERVYFISMMSLVHPLPVKRVRRRRVAI